MEYVLQLQNISRIYNNGIVANKNINLDVMKGEIHAIVGENGAGKSTLMKMIYGMERPNSGAILINGKEVNFASSQDAINMSVGMVHQHFMLMQSLTVGENLIINTKFSKYGILSDEQIDKITSEQCQKYGFNLNSRDVVSSLSVGNQQQLEILKALYRGAKILILDEPTAVLTPQETKKLFEQLIYLKSIGHTILFISHKLGEVMEISDRISVLRQGTIVSTHLKKDVNPELLSNLIVGKAFNEKIDKPQQVKGAKQLQISNL
ncbi:MAG: ATP-binding cassette domain-containing protein, partial [Clostridia bacterium]